MTDSEALDLINKKLRNSEGFLISVRLTHHNLSLKYPDLYDFLISRFQNCFSITESIYRLEHSIENIPLCPICGKPLKFKGSSLGYQVFCSSKCKNSEQGKQMVQSKTIQTIRQKYGVDWFTQSKDYIDKSKQTSLSKYGTSHHTQSEIVKHHNRETCLEKYGVEFSFQSENNKNKSKETLIKNYGVSSPMQSPIIYQKYLNTCSERYDSSLYILSEDFRNKQIISRRQAEKEKYLKEGYDLDFIGNGLVTIHNCCPIHGEITMSIHTFFNRRANHQCLCTICNPIEKVHSSSQEILIEQYLKDHNISFKMHDKKILGNNKELDFFIPDFNVAIECNGVYWHSIEAGSYKDYQIEKSRTCESKGIKLIHIWEDEMFKDPNEIYRFLDIEFNCAKISLKVQDCIFEMSEDTISIKYDNSEIAYMTYRKNNNVFSISGFNVFKGFSILDYKTQFILKLIDAFDPSEIYIIVDFNKDNGLYLKNLGFYLSSETGPRCLYVCDRIMDRTFDKTSDNFWQCYDCGLQTYIYQKEKRSSE